MSNSDIQRFRRNLLGEGVPLAVVECLKQDDFGVGGVGRAIPNGRPDRRDAVRIVIRGLNKLDIDPCLYAQVITWATGREVKISRDGLVYGGKKPGAYPAPFGTPENIVSEVGRIRNLPSVPTAAASSSRIDRQVHQLYRFSSKEAAGPAGHEFPEQSEMDADEIQNVLEKAKQVFFSPAPCYPYKDIITGVTVVGPNGKNRTMMAVASNSFVHYKFRGEASKILGLYQDYFIANRHAVLETLCSAASRTAFDTYADQIRDFIIKKYNTMGFAPKPDISHYNRTRKIIDLYFEHIVAMAEELSQVRKTLVPFLFLPLDSKMFTNTGIFTDLELQNAGVSRSSTYGSLEKRSDYLYLQDLLIEKAKAFSGTDTFYPIYFDMMWGEGKSSGGTTLRHVSWGGNLFQTNLGVQ